MTRRTGMSSAAFLLVDRFVRAARTAMDAVLADPLRYQPIEEGIRVYWFKDFPFRLYYRVDEAAAFVCIYAVMHEKRSPAYWHGRVDPMG